MALRIVGDRDPFLLVELSPGESVFAQSDAMVSMSTNLKLTGELRGGLLQSLGRKALGGETLFTQKLSAPNDSGQALLAPAAPGDILLLDLPPEGVALNDSAFLAATSEVALSLRVQGLIKGLLANTGGLVTMTAEGSGQLAVHGFGSILELGVDEDALVVDTGHVVCWSKGLSYQVGVRTHKRQTLLGGLFNSALTGEGLILTFRGHGSVWVASRNYNAFTQALGAVVVKTQPIKKASSSIKNPR